MDPYKILVKFNNTDPQDGERYKAILRVTAQTQVEAVSKAASFIENQVDGNGNHPYFTHVSEMSGVDIQYIGKYVSEGVHVDSFQQYDSDENTYEDVV